MIGPGLIAISRPDLARHERSREREIKRHLIAADQLAAYLLEHGEFPPDPEPTRVITGWSRDSRTRFLRTMLELDFTPLASQGRPTAMITLTYPGDWLTVAPTGKAVKAHLSAFRQRYQRAWGEPLTAVWKLEFQYRGAPHFHLLMSPPHGLAGAARKGKQRAAVGDGLPFKEWLSAVWADIVAHPDPAERAKHERAGTGLDFDSAERASDPKRAAFYFWKYGIKSAKEYQHCVPEQWREPGKGPGRFWGCWGIDRAVAGREVAPADAIRAARILRRWSAAQGGMRKVSVPRVDTATGRVRWRNVTRPVRRLKNGTGWIAVNDGPAMGQVLARALIR